MKKIMLLGLAILFIVAFVLAQEEVREYYKIGDDGFSSIYGNEWRSQPFRVGINGSSSFNITQIGIKIYRQGNPGNLYVNITRTLDNGKPNLTAMDITANLTFDPDVISTDSNGVWYNITLTDAVLDLGSNYSVMLYGATDSSNRVLWRTDSGGANYPYDYTYSSSGGATWTVQSGTTAMFEIYGTPITPPDDIITTLVSPINGSSFVGESQVFNASLTPEGNANLTNATLYLWNSTAIVNNSVVNSITGQSQNWTDFNITNIDLGVYVWNVYGCASNGTDTLCDWAEHNRTIERKQFSVDAIAYDLSVYDTDNSTFEINISIDPSVNFDSGSLNYNGTNYLADSASIGGGVYRLFRTLDIPVVSQNETKNFYWTVVFDNGDSVEDSDPYTQEIAPTSFNQSCVAPQIEILNYTVLDEADHSPLNVDGQIYLEWYLGGGSYVKNNSFDLANFNSDTFCVNTNQTFITTARIDLEENGYASKSFDFVKEFYSSQKKTEYLYMLNTSDASNIIVEVKDSGLAPLEGWVVKIYRFYPDLGQHKLVVSRVTDSFGQLVAKLVENDVRYRFEFYDTDNVLRKTSSDISIACRSTICVLPFVIEDEGGDFDRFETIDGYSSNLSFDDTTNIFRFVWNDNTGNTPTHRLLVTRFEFNASSIICNLTSTALIGNLECSVGSQKATYKADAYRIVDNVESRIATLGSKVGDIVDTFGFEGLIWVFLLLMTLIAVGSWSPVVGVVLYMVGFIFLGVADIIALNPLIFWANLAIGVMFIWAFKS